MTGPRLHRAFTPLQALYAGGLALKNLGYDRQWWKPRRLLQPVVSVGNISVGGAGKTPVVIALARLLAQQEIAVDVLSRGYGRRSMRPVERVASGGDAERYGDEPLLIAQATGVPVYVGASRYQAGCLAEQDHAPGPAVHLLDDGFQHRRLARTVDLVVLHPQDIHDHLLPVGRLREPLRALRRADILILRDDDSASEAVLRRAGIVKPIWRVARRLVVPPHLESAAAFCAIAHPAEFFDALGRGGLRLHATLAFRDHHVFTLQQLRAIAGTAYGAPALLTTEKDYARLSGQARAVLQQAAPLLAVPLHADLLEPASCLRTLLPLLTGSR